MRFFLSLLVLAFALQDVQAEVSLTDFAWDYRVLVALDDAATLRSFLTHEQDGQRERKLIWFARHHSAWTSSLAIEELPSKDLERLREQYDQQSRGLLIGLDGGIKHLYLDLSWSQIFQDIDRMPMRQEELLRQQF